MKIYTRRKGKDKLETDTDFQVINSYLQKLNFSSDAIKLYFSLSKYGSLSIFQAAKLSKVERTKIYRLIDELSLKNLISIKTVGKRKFVEAADPKSIYLIVEQEKNKINSLSETFLTFSNILESIQPQKSENKSLNFEGTEGFKEMLFNELSSKSEILRFVHTSIKDSLGNRFAKEWYVQEQKNKLEVREIHLKGAQKLRDTTPSRQKKYLWKANFPLPHNVSIYGNTVAIYTWEGEHFIGEEIHSELASKINKRMFETFWNTAFNDY